MRKSSNPAIYFDNSDQSDFKFTHIFFEKWLLKKFYLKIKILEDQLCIEK